ncbi:MAG: hypothetical protein AB1348_02170 [Nitrospirota bacterium]
MRIHRRDCSEGPEERCEWLRDVYKETGEDIALRFPRAVREFIAIDFSIPGCPIDKNYFLHCLGYLLKGVLPEVPNYSVCMECKMRENECLLHYRRLPCMGPVTRGGCGARQPSLNLSDMERNLKILAEELIKEKKDIRHDLETLIRAYDPCISCSVHIIRL